MNNCVVSLAWRQVNKLGVEGIYLWSLLIVATFIGLVGAKRWMDDLKSSYGGKENFWKRC